MLEWNELVNLLLNSIQIVGVFIAIIIGLIISKVIEIDNEKNSLKEAISDIEDELKLKKQKFEDFKIINYSAYKEDVIEKILDSILNEEKYEFDKNYQYVDMKYQKEFYEYVVEYVEKIRTLIIDGKDKKQCRKELQIEEFSIEETILDRIY